MSESYDFNFENDGDEPEIWDEFQWEEFMREADKRTDKYLQLLEKYMDHPDRDIIIAKEMGWDWLSDALENEDVSDENEWLGSIADELDEGEEWKQRTDYEQHEFDDVENLRVYQLAFEYGIDASKLDGTQSESEPDESVITFRSSAYIPAAKIAGGFGLGFEMDSLGGNIANCKRGLAAANKALEALQEMREKKLIDKNIFLEFYRRGKEVRDELGIYIIELREKFNKGLY